MFPNLTEAIIAYGLIPLYFIGLLLVIYLIARYQLGLSALGENKRAHQQQTTPKSAYMVLGLLFALFILLTLIVRRREHA